MNRNPFEILISLTFVWYIFFTHSVPPPRKVVPNNVATSQIPVRPNVQQGVNPAAMNIEQGTWEPGKRTLQRSQSV